MKLECAGATDTGRVREANEDSIRIDPARSFVMVADGVGGGLGGSVASAVAADIVHAQMAEELDQIRAEGRSDDRDTRLRITTRLQQALAAASAAIFEQGQATPSLRGMATTSVVLQVLNGWALIGHVGDSRAYLIRGSRPYQLTEDHSLALMMLARGAITREQAEDFHNNVIVRALGLKPTVEVDVISFELVPGDVLLLCSDGLSDPVTPDEMLQIVRSMAPADSARALVDRANQLGGPDNISVALIQASGGEPRAAIPMELKVELLQHVALFRDLTFQEAARMLSYVHEQRFQANEQVFGEGETGDWFYIVAEGSVAVSQRGVMLTMIERGGHFGELALVTDTVRSATARAMGPTTLLMIGRESFMWLVRHDHALSVKLLWGLLSNLADRVKTLSTQLTWAAG